MNRGWLKYGWVILPVGLIAAAAFWWLRLSAPGVEDRVYRIGWMISPPFQVRGADGNAAGISVDVVNEAARRRGIRLKWVFWEDSSESALLTKSVDLWPLITITEDRLKVLHITEPYLEHGHCLLVREDSAYKQVSDLTAARVGIANVSIDSRHLRTILPRASSVPQNRIESVIDDVCQQRTDAAFMDRYTAIAALLEQSGCAGHRLRWIGVPQIRSRLGVGSTFEARAAADAIRDEIGVMGTQGRVSAVFGRWGFMSGQDVESVEALVNARRREIRLIVIACGFALLSVMAGLQTLWLVRERARTRRTELALRESQELYLQAQKLEGIGRLAGGVAHDFNNILTVINGYGDIVYHKLREGDPLRPAIDEIRKAGERAAELTQQLLAFGRKQVSRPRPLNLNSAVAESERMFRRILGEDIELVTKLSPSLGMVMMDKGQVHQVLMNLVVNARDAMPDGGRLLIETSEIDSDPRPADARGGTRGGPVVALAVTDSGTGMDEATRKHLFEPFFTTKAPAKGTGLGLATVYGIVQQGNGWIRVSSEPGKGATFQIYLPRIEGGPAQAVPAPVVGDLRGTETVLLVEDQSEVRALAVQALASYGYRVVEAKDGSEALALADRHAGTIHVLLTDVVLPGMNGRELADALRITRPGLKVIYTSGYTQNLIDVPYVPKPYTPEQIAAKVREVM